MKQTQPSTATLEAASMPVAGRKIATGVFDTWSEVNLWQKRTFSAELRWGVRYSQSDPVGLDGGLNLFSYGNQNPNRFIDPEGLEWIAPLPGPGDRDLPTCTPTSEMMLCLETLFAGYGADLAAVDIVVAPGFVRNHGPGIAATTRPNKIFVRSCSGFFNDPYTIVHEYVHVLMQWKPNGSMGYLGYISETAEHVNDWFSRASWYRAYLDNKYEVEARAIASEYGGWFQDCADLKCDEY